MASRPVRRARILSPLLVLPLVWLGCSRGTGTEGQEQEKGEAEVHLPEVRTMDWQVVPYFSVEGAKTSVTTFSVERVERGHIDIAPHLKTVRSAGTNARWTSEFSVHFTPDAEQTGLVRAKDFAGLGYEFDDGLFYTNLKQELQMDYDLLPERSGRREQMVSHLRAGHRFQWVDWGFSFDRKEQARCEALERELLRDQWDERAWVKLKPVDLFRPTLTVARREVTSGAVRDDLRRLDADGEVLALGADGSWGDRFAWRGNWTGEQVSDGAWAPRDSSLAPDWDHSALTTSLMWRPCDGAPRLDLSFSQQSGYESEQRYREDREWSLRAAQQLTSCWQAHARAGWMDRTDPDGNEARRLSAGVATTFSLTPRTQLSGEYRYAKDEQNEAPLDTQIRLQLKMKW